MKRIFAVEKLARDSGISRKELIKIWKQVREEFPNDHLMQELHMIRAIMGMQRPITEIERRS